MYDYHSHTDFSDDSAATMDEMIEGAIQKGILELAITDHYDPDYPDPNYPFEVDFDEYHKALLHAEQHYAPRIRIVKGLEIGIQNGDTLKKCKAAAKNFSYDFLIGSFHSFNGTDLYTANYSEMDQDRILPSFYTYVHDCLKEFDDFDVLGHMNVIDRYLNLERDYSESLMIIEEILKELISKGKGLEINTSSYRYGLKDRNHPTKEILQLYRDLGGEILTIGSDAHRPSDLLFRFEEGVAFAENHGFKYFSTFQNRKVTMLPLSKFIVK
jgi:histidinol-phosphatase (PHP family)